MNLSWWPLRSLLSIDQDRIHWSALKRTIRLVAWLSIIHWFIDQGPHRSREIILLPSWSVKVMLKYYYSGNCFLAPLILQHCLLGDFSLQEQLLSSDLLGPWKSIHRIYDHHIRRCELEASPLAWPRSYSQILREYCRQLSAPRLMTLQETSICGLATRAHCAPPCSLPRPRLLLPTMSLLWILEILKGFARSTEYAWHYIWRQFVRLKKSRIDLDSKPKKEQTGRFKWRHLDYAVILQVMTALCPHIIMNNMQWVAIRLWYILQPSSLWIGRLSPGVASL